MGDRKYRKSRTRTVNRDFLIITNGAKSEKVYFELLGKKSIYRVKVDFYDGDLLNLVRYAIKVKDGANQVWCVFDIDSTPKEKTINEAIALAKINDINLAYSNPSFETFLICHFQEPKKGMSQKEQINLLTSLIEKTNPNMVYKKGDYEMTSKIFIPRYKRAYEISKKGYENYLKVYNNMPYPIWKFEASSNVFLLIDALNLDNRKS